MTVSHRRWLGSWFATVSLGFALGILPIPVAHADGESVPELSSRPEVAATHKPVPVSASDDDTAIQEQAAKQLRPQLPSGSDKVSALPVTPVNGAGSTTHRALPTGVDKSGVTSQAISLPSGAGTIKGLEESFSAQLSTGVATFNLPFAVPTARGDAQPGIALSYASGAGFGIAGAGWNLSVPFIARQTDRRLPRYQDQTSWHPEQDRFVFNGGQELVPICVVGDPNYGCTAGRLADGEVLPAWTAAGDQYFRARVEGSFLRFFWHATHETWRVQDKSGVTMEFGVPLNNSSYKLGLERNPDDPREIYRWHLVRQYDAYGNANPAAGAPQPVNAVVYRYFQDAGMAYLADVYDTPPAASPTSADLRLYSHHTRLSYAPRTDPTTSYRSGWKIEQRLRLVGVDVTSKTFDEGTNAPREIVRRYHLSYEGARPTRHVSLLQSVRMEGRCTGGGAREAEVSINAQCPVAPCEVVQPTSCPSLPPMNIEYTAVDPDKTVLGGYEVFDEDVQHLAASPKYSVDEALTDLFDANSDSLPDIVVTAAGLFGGKHGLFLNGFHPSGAGSNRSGLGFKSTTIAVQQADGAILDGVDAGVLTFGNSNVIPFDLDGDGLGNLVHMPRVKKYEIFTPLLQAGQWIWSGRSVTTASGQDPKIDFTNAFSRTRVMDVNFDGLIDVVVTTGTELQTFFALGRYPEGDDQFGHARWTSPTTADISNEPVTSCLPWSATPIQFDDSDVHIGDMNGDGLPDIVRVRAGEVRYWPGRGNGFWGTGPRDDCKAGAFGQDRHVAMDKGPQFGVVQGNTLLFDDVNGDGLDDIVEVRFNAVDIYLNVDGRSWTDRHVLFGTPPKPESTNRVRLVDIDGSGTRDILWGDGREYKYIDLQRGIRPWLVARIDNGLGKTTRVEYSTSTAEMVAADAKTNGVPCGAAQLQADRFVCPWTERMPLVAHVVKRVATTDNHTVAGRGPGNYVTEYTYRDAVYDGRQREFRGFRHTRAVRPGDSNSPTDVTQTSFLLGECKDETPGDGMDPCQLSERWRDNPREGLKGLPVIADQRDEHGTYLFSEFFGYRLRSLYQGLDERSVRHPFVARSERILYDTAAFVAAGVTEPWTAVELQERNGIVAADDAVSIVVRSTNGTARVRTRSEVDLFGNRTRGISDGCVSGPACPNPDEVLTLVTEPHRPAGDSSGWIWRTAHSFVTGSRHPGGGDLLRRDETFALHNAQGDPVRITGQLSGTVGLDRFHERQFDPTPPAPSPLVAPPPGEASTDGSILITTREYDALGNMTRETAPNGRCREIGHDGAYQQLTTLETVYAGEYARSATPGTACGGTALRTAATYDRGFEVVTLSTDMRGQPTLVEYDAFARLATLTRPNPHSSGEIGYRGIPGLSAKPSVLAEYLLAPALGTTVFHSIIHSRIHDAADHNQPATAEDGYLDTFAYVDGFGRTILTLAEADTAAGDAGRYIVSGFVDYDDKGALRRKFLEFYYDGDPKAFPLGAAPSAPFARQRHDAFGRQFQNFDLDGTVTLERVNHALSTDVYDAADRGPSPHAGTPVTERLDGHGRSIGFVERYHNGSAIEARVVRVNYLPTGQPEVVSRLRFRAGVDVARAPPPDASTADEHVVRWMRYDSLGRMVLNVEPNTSPNFTADIDVSAAPGEQGLKAWRYAYNDAGDLVGTSDARGCGVNYRYDAAGRLLSEDYSPCKSTQAPYSAPDSTFSHGIEVLYLYDGTSPLPSGITPPPGFAQSAAFSLGRIFAVFDRASATFNTHDGRGRLVRRDVRIAKPSPFAHDDLSERYAPRWYTRQLRYDAGDREVLATTGSTVAALQGLPVQVPQTFGTAASTSTSAVVTSYSRRGVLEGAGGSFDTLVGDFTRHADGRVKEMRYGDHAETTSAFGYDDRRRLRVAQTFRSRPPLWSNPPPGYQPAPAPETAGPSSLQLLLQDEEFTYDAVNNPVEIRDWRNADEWPGSAKPVTRKIAYDDLYRVRRMDYQYEGGDDEWTSPYAADNSNDPDLRDTRRPQPGPHVDFDRRLLRQTFGYDWLGNTALSEDDTRGFYDRSLGVISNGTPSAGPYALKAASNKQGNTGARSGDLDATYDESGNLVRMVVERNGPCLPQGAKCSHIFAYDWDEAGRLIRARRWDRNPNNLPGIEEPPPNSGESVTLNYEYNASDQRVRKTAVDPPSGGGGGGSNERHTIYIFESLELRRTSFGSQSGGGNQTFDYDDDETTEVVYLFANGARLARVEVEDSRDDEPRLDGRRLHVFIELGDHLGSTTVVLDQATGELVERATYQAYGATESDYRPERWDGFREDYRFTGKEEDIEVGLQYFGKRYYAPFLQRWISPDPLSVHSLGGDLNLYAYVHGQTLKATDPLGLEEVPEPSEVHEVSNTPREQGGRHIVLSEVVISETGYLSVPEEPPPPPPPPEPKYHPEVGGECPGCHGYRGIEHPEHPGSIAYGYQGGVPEQGTIDPAAPAQAAWNLATGALKGLLPFTLALPELGDAVVPRAEYAPGSENFGATLELGGAVALSVVGARGRMGSLPRGVPRGSSLGTRGPASGARIISPPRPGQVLLGGRDNPMGAIVFEGHGHTAPGSFMVPEGTWLQLPKTPVLDEAVAQAAAMRGTFPAGTSHILPPGSTAPNLVLHAPKPSMTVRPSSTIVTRPTLLQDMLEPHMGLCVWGACQ